MTQKGLMAKRIPTIAGILILLGGLVAGVVLVNNRQGLVTKAGPTASPKNVKISNKGSNTFAVSWTTDTPVTGFIKYSQDPTKINTPAGDIRDQISGSSQGYTNHYVVVSGLSADKTIYFKIGSGSQTYDDGGKPFQVRTGPQVIAPIENVINGKILGADGNAVNNAIVYVEVEGGETLSAMTNSEGTWKLNLGLSRDSKGAVLTYDAETALISIFVESGISGTATAITNTGKAKPVPDIVLGKNQSFVETATASTSAVDDTASKSSGFKSIAEEATSTVTTEATESATTVITNPAINGEMIATSSPEFRGKVTAGTSIKITVHSAIEMTQVIKADKDGNWKWTPPQGLEAGVHTLTLEYTDENNVFQKIVRTFTVLAADKTAGLPAFTATPSATVTATPSATLTATPTVKMPATTSGTLTDTGTLSITVILGILGLLMLVFGRVSKDWWKD